MIDSDPEGNADAGRADGTPGAESQGGFGGPASDMAAGTGWGGIANTAGYAQRQGVGGLSTDKSLTGFNAENPTQSIGELENSQRVDGILGSVAPTLAGMAVPGFGVAMGVAKTGQNLLNGMPIGEAIGGHVAGAINGYANKLSGGILGQANTVAGLARSAGVDVPSLNIGKEVVGALGIGPSGKSYGGAQQAQAATSAGDYVAMGLDSEGWTKREGVTT